ncbi:MAG: hypothetical protein KKB25_03025 [Nanoarchaeota archaeon]|nr:hypothetical protein [Nanoarchaeota archaeon]
MGNNVKIILNKEVLQITKDTTGQNTCYMIGKKEGDKIKLLLDEKKHPLTFDGYKDAMKHVEELENEVYPRAKRRVYQFSFEEISP